MESAAALRSFHCTGSDLKSVLERPAMITMNNAAFGNISKLPVYGRNMFSTTNRHGKLVVSCVKASEATTVADKPKGDHNGAVLPASPQNGSEEKKLALNATFSNGFEALLTQVCDETKIAELKVKVGDFEIHMKRKIEGQTIPAPFFAQTAVTDVPSTPASESISVPPPPPKSSTKNVSPFSNVSFGTAAKLAKLEASGASGYVVVSSPTVGSFQRARSLKGKKQPPACKEGDVIKEGQILGFVDQFGPELPVRSDVAGEVLKILYSDGEAVGYGDPLVAVLPSFPGIE